MQHCPRRPWSPTSGKEFSPTWEHQCRHMYCSSSATERAHCKSPRELSSCGHTHQLNLAALQGLHFIFILDAKQILGGFVVSSLFLLYMSFVFIRKHQLPGEHWQVLERAFKVLLLLWVFALEWVRFSSPCKREVAHSVVNFANNRAKCRGAAAPFRYLCPGADLEEKTMKVSLICLSSLQQSDAFCHLYW